MSSSRRQEAGSRRQGWNETSRMLNVSFHPCSPASLPAPRVQPCPFAPGSPPASPAPLRGRWWCSSSRSSSLVRQARLVKRSLSRRSAPARADDPASRADAGAPITVRERRTDSLPFAFQRPFRLEPRVRELSTERRRLHLGARSTGDTVLYASVDARRSRQHDHAGGERGAEGSPRHRGATSHRVTLRRPGLVVERTETLPNGQIVRVVAAVPLSDVSLSPLELLGAALVVSAAHPGAVRLAGRSSSPRTPPSRSSESRRRSSRSPTAAASTDVSIRRKGALELAPPDGAVERNDRAARDVLRRPAPLYGRRQPRAQDTARGAARRRGARDARDARRHRATGRARGGAPRDDAHGGPRREPAHAGARRRRTLRPAAASRSSSSRWRTMSSRRRSSSARMLA